MDVEPTVGKFPWFMLGFLFGLACGVIFSDAMGG